MIPSVPEAHHLSFCIIILGFCAAQTFQNEEFEEKYIIPGEPVNLRCFEEQPKDEEIQRYEWLIDQYIFNEGELDYYDEYNRGESKGDIEVISASKNDTAICTAIVNGTEADRKKYSLIIGRLPDVDMYANGVRLNNSLPTDDQKTNITCEAKNGIPQSNITLSIDDDFLDSVEHEDSLSAIIDLSSHDGKNLVCSVETVYDQKITKKVQINFQFSSYFKSG